ncbi:MAG: MFS transporter [Acidimicrobiales bacterium]|nr:MAG: MFS transporter [Acidimicrobiales bacterium]
MSSAGPRASSQDSMTAGHPARWHLLGGVVALYFCFGVVLTSIAPILSVVQDDLGASRSQMGVILSSWALVFIFTAPLAGRAIDRIGLPVGLFFAGLSIAISAVARALSPSTAVLWFAVALFGIGGPLVSTGAPALVARFFADERERQRAVSMYAVAPALGSVAVLAATNQLLLPWLGSWRAVLAFEAGLTVAATIGWALISRTDSTIGPPSRTTQAARTSGGTMALARDRGVQAALVTAFLLFFLNHSLNTWYPTLLEDIGDLSPDAASTWVAASVAVGIGAALGVPRLAAGRSSATTLAALAIATTVGLLVVAAGPGMTIGAGALVVGLRGAFIPLGAMLLLQTPAVTADNAGTANGIWFAAGEVGGVSGPILIGVLSGQSSETALYAIAVVGVCVAGAMVPYRRARFATGPDLQ